MRNEALALCLATVFALACSDQSPTAPGAVLNAPAPLFSNGANQGWEEGENSFTQTNFVPCLGEEVTVSGTVPYRYHTVENAAGGYSDFMWFAPSGPKDPFTALGETSGIVWEGRGGTDPFMSHAGPNVTGTVMFNETFISKDGPTFHLNGVIHWTVNANGEATADVFNLSIRCGGPR
jgi:hypothetical protein